MTWFLIAYVTVWLGVTLYVIRLGAEQRRLSLALESLRQQSYETGQNARQLPSARTPAC